MKSEKKTDLSIMKNSPLCQSTIPAKPQNPPENCKKIAKNEKQLIKDVLNEPRKPFPQILVNWNSFSVSQNSSKTAI